MKKLADKLHISIKVLYMSCIAFILILLFAALFVSKLSISSRKVDSVIYNSGEQTLHDSVVEYLTNVVSTDPDDNNYSKIADMAVENYDIIVNSGVASINSDHTVALQENIKNAIMEYIPEADQMTDEHIEFLSANITEMIINNIIEQMEALSEEDYKEYENLYSSLKEQAEYLNDQKMQITITATVKDSYLNPEMLLNLLDNMTDQEKDIFAEQLAATLGTTKDNLDSFIKSSQINPDVLNWLTKVKSVNDLKGEKGDKGDTGAQGEKGDKGDTGDDGDKGDTGAQGEKGDKGDTGAQGEKGDKGDTGAQGEKGDKGDTGVQGEKGDKGDTGAQGEKGDKGDTGVQGEKGDKGDTGAQGEKGDDGYTPIKGVDYLTEDDVNDMASKAASISESNLQAILGDQVTYRYDSNTNTLYITTK